MPSILCGIPSFDIAFTSSPYAKQHIQSLVSELNDLGYDTSFFHGAPNGSMGFLGFANILGFDHYYGKEEFGDDSQFDGVWGIWDEPFFNYMGKVLSQKQQPFMATLFSTSSHHPFHIPRQYEGKFDKGKLPIHQTVGYTDFALRSFFNTIRDKPWFEKTLFVITADHTNQIGYNEYKKPINRFAVPIIFYTPKGALSGEDMRLAQQIDIYPTILNIIGSEKPFFSLGESLLNSDSKPFVITHNGNIFYGLSEQYICVFDGQKALGFYDINDKGLQTNLIEIRSQDMTRLENFCKAFVQNYMNRIVERRLYYNPQKPQLN
ncbi:phosphoglycerol transferase [Elysia marginata]|uniref:Phosphoglycerol transferase n=1 Tax=Elysia marginata TaxID=1093978 RepID=A0AAV4H2Q8_9GAST|nr:phosphoglycerol transferase [Elysia marginata]